MQIAACKCILLHWRSLHVAMYNSVLIGQSAPRNSYHCLEVAECVHACMLTMLQRWIRMLICDGRLAQLQ